MLQFNSPHSHYSDNVSKSIEARGMAKRIATPKGSSGLDFNVASSAAGVPALVSAPSDEELYAEVKSPAEGYVSNEEADHEYEAMSVLQGQGSPN